MQLDPLNDQKFVEEIFDDLLEALKDKDARALISWEQKRDALIALGLKLEVADENHAKISFLFFTLNVDTTDESKPKITFEVDFNSLIELTAKKAENDEASSTKAR